jgi:hypothetical protein
MALEKELETYHRELAKLLVHEGKYVLIHGESVAGLFDTQEEAVEAGDDRFGLDPFLVHQIREKEPVRFVPFNITPQCPS